MTSTETQEPKNKILKKNPSINNKADTSKYFFRKIYPSKISQAWTKWHDDKKANFKNLRSVSVAWHNLNYMIFSKTFYSMPFFNILRSFKIVVKIQKYDFEVWAEGNVTKISFEVC